jgi:hypothetical protein
MTRATLLARLTALADSLGYVRPEVTVRDGVVWLSVVADTGGFAPARRRFAGSLGLARAGWRRLEAALLAMQTADLTAE